MRMFLMGQSYFEKCLRAYNTFSDKFDRYCFTSEAPLIQCLENILSSSLQYEDPSTTTG